MYAIRSKNKERIKAVCPDIDERSGIYCFTRFDENGFRYAYVGQATKSVLERCAEHLEGYRQHIDLSLKKHGLFSEKNPYGWSVAVLCYCQPDRCDEKEKLYIKKAHEAGRQLLNTTAGSQGEGKHYIAQSKPPKGYRDGLAQGYKNAQKDIAHLFRLHLSVSTKKQPPTKLQEKALEKFNDFLEVEKNESKNND